MLQPDGKALDPHSLHTACPVIKGVKYVGELLRFHSPPWLCPLARCIRVASGQRAAGGLSLAEH